MFHNFCQTLFIASRSCWVQTPTLVQLEHMANSLLELAILMQVLCWALGSCCSRSIDALVWFLTVYYAVYLIFLRYLMLDYLCTLFDVRSRGLANSYNTMFPGLLSFGNHAVILLCSIYTRPHFTNFCYARMILIFILRSSKDGCPSQIRSFRNCTMMSAFFFF
jgi:hypothetical protein